MLITDELTSFLLLESAYKFVWDEEPELFGEMTKSISHRLLTMDLIEWLADIKLSKGPNYRSIHLSIVSPNELTLLSPNSCNLCFPYVIWISSGIIMYINDQGRTQMISKKELQRFLKHYVQSACPHHAGCS
jgi:hypothetical protein